ncbi:MAG: hypothetical protein IKA84_01120 [Clostridia bacterium]|nr:hypothetical protein [Clostridia bacterium]
MGHNKPQKSLTEQVNDNLNSKLAIGESKYEAKLKNAHTEKIYSWSTYKAYLKHCCYFVKWCKEQPADARIGHKVRTLEECRLFVEKWIQAEMDRGQSPYTIKLEACALAKLYSCGTTDFDIITPQRKRSNITRSRGIAERDKNFSEKNNADLITFCKCTGLRRGELSQIRGTDLIEKDGKYFLHITKNTKGGRARVSPIVGDENETKLVIELCKKSKANKIFPNPSKNADIHSYRGEYAARIYNLHKRHIHEFKNERLIIYKNEIVKGYTSKSGRKLIKGNEDYYTTINGKKTLTKGFRDVRSAYYCRKDLKGTLYDRKALFAASRALGHNRESIVAEHYLASI